MVSQWFSGSSLEVSLFHLFSLYIVIRMNEMGSNISTYQSAKIEELLSFKGILFLSKLSKSCFYLGDEDDLQ